MLEISKSGLADLYIYIIDHRHNIRAPVGANKSTAYMAKFWLLYTRYILNFSF